MGQNSANLTPPHPHTSDTIFKNYNLEDKSL